MDLSALGSFPVLQFFGGLLVLTIGVLAYVRGQRDKQALPAVAPMPDGLQIFMGGPLERALKLLDDLHRCAEENNRVLLRIEAGQRASAARLMTRCTK